MGGGGGGGGGDSDVYVSALKCIFDQGWLAVGKSGVQFSA